MIVIIKKITTKNNKKNVCNLRSAIFDYWRLLVLDRLLFIAAAWSLNRLRSENGKFKTRLHRPVGLPVRMSVRSTQNFYRYVVVLNLQFIPGTLFFIQPTLSGWHWFAPVTRPQPQRVFSFPHYLATRANFIHTVIFPPFN